MLHHLLDGGEGRHVLADGRHDDCRHVSHGIVEGLAAKVTQELSAVLKAAPPVISSSFTRSGPSPIIFNRKSQPCLKISAAAESSTETPFSRTRRPTYAKHKGEEGKALCLASPVPLSFTP